MRLNEFKPLFEGANDGGNCYDSAAEFVLSNPDYELIHGVVTGQGAIQGMKYGHAWAEKDGMVVDSSNGNNINIPAQVYYRIGNIDPDQQHRYTAQELRIWIGSRGHWGPWEEGVSPESDNHDHLASVL